jgi:hypothetical protein
MQQRSHDKWRGAGGVYAATRATTRCLGMHVAGHVDDMRTRPCRHVGWPEHRGVQWQQQRESRCGRRHAAGAAREWQSALQKLC